MSGEIYSDDVITLDDGGLTLSKYYFPLGSAKRIEYADIKGVAVETMNWATGKGRVWGATDPRFWLPLDKRRHKKSTLLVFGVGKRVKPCVTPDDPDRVLELLRERVSVA